MRIDVFGQSFHYEVRGDLPCAQPGWVPPPAGETCDPVGGAHPVLFLHGFSQSLNTWYPVVDAMRHERSVMLDLIGHGESSKPEHDVPYTLFSQVEQVEAIRQGLALGPVRVVGYSMGGRVALMYALRYPASVSALVLESASFGPRSPEEREAYAARDRAMAERLSVVRARPYRQRAVADADAVRGRVAPPHAAPVHRRDA
jgi:pimeloyl-ACP methyl ester carboxylesterase